DGVARLDLAVDLAIDHHGAAGDIGGHLGGLADDEQVIRRDLAGEGPVEADLALEAQLSFENEARSESGVARSVAAALVFTHFCGLPSCRRRPCRGRVSLNANGKVPLRNPGAGTRTGFNALRRASAGNSRCSMLGSRPRREGMIHIWMKRIGSVFEPLRSECCMPEPSVARWTAPG